jgi:hypothetical protein
LPLDIRIEHFLKEIQVNKQLADWQLRQAEEAVRIYVTQFLSGNVGCLSPNTVSEITDPDSHDPESALARMRELIRLRHLARSTERTYFDWARRFFAFKAQRGSKTTMIYTHVMRDMTTGPKSPLDLLGGQ